MPVVRSKKVPFSPKTTYFGIINKLIVDMILNATLSVAVWVGSSICHISTFTSATSLCIKSCYESVCLLVFALLLLC